jgi:hypothetical protein
MAADVSFGAYDRPAAVESSRSEWIVVSCWGESGGYLSLSLTGFPRTGDGPAPLGLQPTETFLALLLARATEAGRTEAKFLVVRERPADITVAGSFHPSDGFVVITESRSGHRLAAHGRYVHDDNAPRAGTVARERSRPVPGCGKARSWHIEGIQRPWIGEFKA